MRCSRCGAENREGRRFCAECGAALATPCPECGFVNQAGEKFCGGCGKPIGQGDERAAAATRMPTGVAPPPEGERRQVTVLFCDLAGYTRLTHELGAEAMHALTDRFFAQSDALIEGFGGSVDKHIGDCVMAVFGAPVAHGNDAERAVRAALAIRAAMPGLGQEVGREVGVHIGIASGQVVASGGGGHRTYSITGDSVNLASRLTDAAEAGTILVSDAMRRTLADRLDCAEAGAIEVKGLSQPVRAFRLIGLRDPELSAGRPFVGRRAELHQLDGALSTCLESGAGQAIYVRGEAGIGKTRLIEECQKRAETLGFASHTGLVLDFGTATGHDAVRELARGLLGLGKASAADAVAAAADSALRERLLGPDRRVYLNDLLDLPQPVELRALYDAMDNVARNRGKEETLAELIVQVSRRTPRLLIVEDVHWADVLTLGHLAWLAQTVTSCPAVLVMTSRLEGDPLDRRWRSKAGSSPLLTLDLGPLRANEATDLASAYFEAGSEFAKRCVERAAGNPLFLEQLLRHAEERTEIGIPDSVQSLVQARLDHLPPADRQALQAASVFGQRFAPDALRFLLKNEDYRPEELVRHFLIRPQSDDFLFAHALIRDAVYEVLLKSRRRVLHGRAAAWYEERDPTLHAEHLDRAEDPRAPLAYLAAARAEIAAYHHERSLMLTQRGLALARGAAERFDLTCLRGDILHDLGVMTEAGAAYREALDVAGDDRERCRALLGLAAVKRVTDDLDGAFADLERAEEVASRLGLAAESARVHFLRGNLFFPRGNIEGCRDEHRRALEAARAASSTELEAGALGGIGDAEYARGRMASAYQSFSRCVEVCRAHGYGRIEVANLSMVAHALVYLKEFDRALAVAREAMELASKVEHRRAEIVACNAVCNVHRSRDTMDLIRDLVERTLDLVRLIGAKRFEAVTLNDLAEVLRAEGRQSEAGAVQQQALSIARETGIQFVGPWILGAIAATTSDGSARKKSLVEGEALLRTGCVGHNHLWFHRYAIEAGLNARDWDGAARAATALEDFTRPEPLPWADFFIARGRSLAAFGAGRRDEPLMEELERLRAEAVRTGLKKALAPIEDALRVG